MTDNKSTKLSDYEILAKLEKKDKQGTKLGDICDGCKKRKPTKKRGKLYLCSSCRG